MKRITLAVILILSCISVANHANATIIYDEGYVEEQAEKGDRNFQLILAYYYFYGSDGYTQNYTEAQKWFVKAAEQNDITAQFQLAGMYLYGEGVPRNYPLAIHWYQTVAEKKLAAAESKLGLLYQYGVGVPQDDITAVSWYKKAAEQDFPLAQYYLGQMYVEGRGVAQDYKAAYTLFVKAATSRYGVINAQYALGLMYYQGTGVARNQCMARDLFQVAARQAYLPAQQILASMQTISCPTSAMYDVLLHLPLLAPYTSTLDP